MSVLVSVVGMVVLVGMGWFLSEKRAAIRWRTVGGAFLIQVALGAFVLWVPWGVTLLDWLTRQVGAVIAAAEAGISFLFGGLVSEEASFGFVFAFQVLPVIVFFSSFIAVLYYLHIMKWVVTLLGGALRKVLGTSRAESLSATANIFVGQTEAPLVVRPYIPRMTPSELFAVMVGGLASVAGSILAGYAEMGVELRYLIAACFMAAPGGLLFAKLIKPEVDEPDESLVEFAEDEERPVNILDAAALGASKGLGLALNVGAMLLAFIGLIALVNLMLGGVGGWFGNDNLSLEGILGWVFAPLAWVIGVPWHEAMAGGSFIGQKLIVNEFVAYKEFVEVADTLTPRTQAIITFALCGFANLSSIAILLGGLGGMAPARRSEIARFGLKAVLAASLANLMSGAIAGVFVGL
ncbi:MAG: NupC/NupG family nucleoside CNT transporter [Akkermansiaceae bacterium]|nr:NupC/NupG family nucleoside CNT transporter [Akkermansiaceae bacterium]NNM28765.1 NupC/NupG family nucleoside CNT transporter [Akkermansiaceae bacterium]